MWLSVTLFSTSCDASWVAYTHSFGSPCPTKSAPRFCSFQNPLWFGSRHKFNITPAVALLSFGKVWKHQASTWHLAPNHSVDLWTPKDCVFFYCKCHKVLERLHGHPISIGIYITASLLGRLSFFSYPIKFLLCILCLFSLPSFMLGFVSISYWFWVLKQILDTHFITYTQSTYLLPWGSLSLYLVYSIFYKKDDLNFNVVRSTMIVPSAFCLRNHPSTIWDFKDVFLMFLLVTFWFSVHL